MPLGSRLVHTGSIEYDVDGKAAKEARAMVFIICILCVLMTILSIFFAV